MLSKSTVKFVQSLKLKKFRQKYNLFVAEGLKVVDTMLLHGGFNLSRVYSYSEEFNTRYESHIADRLVVSERSDLKKLSSQKNPSDVLAIFEIPEISIEKKNLGDKNVIYLDDIQDPGNVGTIIRIADWFGIDMVIRSSKSADFYNPKTIQASMGSLSAPNHFTLPTETFEEYFSDHIKIAGSVELNKSDIHLGHNKYCLIVSNEGHGISEEINPLVDQYLHIPGAVNRSAESLNVAVATGILCNHLFDQSLK